MLGLVAAYFIFAVWTSAVAGLRGAPPALISPASGIALALVLLRGFAVWPLILLASIAAALPAVLISAGGAVVPVVGSTLLIGAGSTVESLLAAWLILRWAGGAYFEQAGPYLVGTLVAIPASAFVAAILLVQGSVLAAIVHIGSWSELIGTWYRVIITDVMGLTTATVPVWLWARNPEPRLTGRQALELLALCALAAVALALHGSAQPTYLLVAAHLVMAVRLPLKWTAAAVALSSCVQIGLSIPGLGTRPPPNLYEVFFNDLFFVFVLNITTYVTALLYRENQEHRKQLETRVTERTRELAQARDRLEHLSRIDPLTGVWNRRYFESSSTRALDHAIQSGRPVGVLVLDLDRFKLINDTHGHDVGDSVLKAVTSRLEHVLRPGDVLARIGGEEFAVLLPECDERYGRQIAERMRTAVAATPVVADSAEVAVTISLGVTVIRPSESEEPQPTLELLQRALRTADQSLYQAKEEGRNRIIGPQKESD